MSRTTDGVTWTSCTLGVVASDTEAAAAAASTDSLPSPLSRSHSLVVASFSSSCSGLSRDPWPPPHPPFLSVAIWWWNSELGSPLHPLSMKSRPWHAHRLYFLTPLLVLQIAAVRTWALDKGCGHIKWISRFWLFSDLYVI